MNRQAHEQEVENGILIGNQVDKSQLRNPLARKLVAGFDRALLEALDSLNPASIHEVGCGEGRLAAKLRERYGVDILASDFSARLIEENRGKHPDGISFEQVSIYDLDTSRHARDIVVCCEVLEHLENPALGMRKLRALNARGYVLSVPREPLWRLLNMLRGKYIRDLGNTPGHLNHWNRRSFLNALNQSGFRVTMELHPFPWLMVVLQPS